MLINKRIPISFILNKIKTEVLIIALLSLVIGYLDERFIFLTIPLTIPAILGTTISLLLAFRTNQAYERWWEARKIWGGIVNTSRQFIRQLQTYYKEGTDKDQVIKDFTRRQIAWSYSLGETLRTQATEQTLRKYLTTDELSIILKYSNIPNGILDLQINAIRQAYINGSITDFQQIRLEDSISKFCDYMGMCERIKNTVFPRTYSIVLHFLIYIFAILLPFGLTNYPMFVEELLNTTFSCIFFIIENTSIYKQDPFEDRPTDVSVTAIARTIERDLLHMTNTEAVPEPLQPQGYYLM